MKYTKIFIVISLLLVSEAYAQTESIKWLTIAEAEALSKKEPRKIIVDIYTPWCGWCKKLDATTYKNPEVVAYINKNYYPVKFNAESKEAITFKGTTYTMESGQRVHSLAPVLMGNSTGYPTTTFLNEKLDVISNVPGYQKADVMINILNYFGDNHYLKTDWNTYISSLSQTVPEN